MSGGSIGWVLRSIVENLQSVKKGVIIFCGIGGRLEMRRHLPKACTVRRLLVVGAVIRC